MAGTFRRDHEHIDIGARFDQTEMDIQTMRENQSRVLFQIRRQMIPVQSALQFIRSQNHDNIRPSCGFGRRHDLELGVFRFDRARAACAQTDNDIFDSAVAQILRVGMSLAAITDDGDFLALDETEIGVFIIINLHDFSRSKV